MGKHDKTLELKWDPPKNEWYEARIRALEDENVKLNKKLGEMELAEERDRNINSGIINELNEEVEELKKMNRDLKDALVRAALREV